MRCSSVVLRDWAAGKNGEDKTILIDTMARIAATVEYRLDGFAAVQSYGFREAGIQIKNRSLGKPGFGFLQHNGSAGHVVNPWKNPQDEIQRRTEKSSS